MRHGGLPLIGDRCPAPMIHQFFIINRSGGMIYKYEAGKQSELNALLVLTSSLHSINHICTKVGEQQDARQIICFRTRVITVFRTVTNLTFVFVSDTRTAGLYEKVYQHYIDFVSKNPFYANEMPISCSKFRPETYFER
jgi:trafficking protein particle complex subunit 4